jgi:hypothetical protein
LEEWAAQLKRWTTNFLEELEQLARREGPEDCVYSEIRFLSLS